MQRKITFEDGELLRHVADLALERTDLRGHVRDLGRQPRLLGARRGEARLDIAELVVVACGRGSQNEPGNEDEGQSAGHERSFGGAPDVPAVQTGASRRPLRPSLGSSGASGPGSGMIAGSGGFPSSGGG